MLFKIPSKRSFRLIKEWYWPDIVLKAGGDDQEWVGAKSGRTGSSQRGVAEQTDESRHETAILWLRDRRRLECRRKSSPTSPPLPLPRGLSARCGGESASCHHHPPLRRPAQSRSHVWLPLRSRCSFVFTSGSYFCQIYNSTFFKLI